MNIDDDEISTSDRIALNLVCSLIPYHESLDGWFCTIFEKPRGGRQRDVEMTESSPVLVMLLLVVMMVVLLLEVLAAATSVYVNGVCTGSSGGNGGAGGNGGKRREGH